MPKTFVIGDIHGSYRALLQCLEKSQFNYLEDHLICLGDVADAWPETRESIDELLKIKNLKYILGNHDFWTLNWMETGYPEQGWIDQGGISTINSYTKDIPENHIAFLRNASPYYIHQNQLFVHAGIRLDIPIHHQGIQTFLWDRNFARQAKFDQIENGGKTLTNFDAVYIGHTPIPEPHPVQYCEVWMMDTGAGWSGRLSMMNIDTLEYFVSDPVPELYPGVTGRQRF